MVRLYLFAEGQTEQTFADNILKQHLANYGVFLDKIVLIAHARKKGKVHRGGGRQYQPMKDDIQRFLKQEKSDNLFFTTMIDLYAISPEFPGLTEAEKLRQNPLERVQFLENSFAQDIDDSRFIPYIQLHEYEAYLFTDPSLFEYFYEGHRNKNKIAELKAIADQYENPELINDGQDTAPSKRIIDQFPAYKKAKVTEGSQVAELIGLQSIRNRCSHFNAWLSKLESLSR
ncbi:MAG: DUF4276 family protein [Coleofasciculus sp. D1-CHI-01]|mgnify:CR=1 FL=1|uniref:DUF4276 family protein n=1 Tax=Coleofasciculus sp. D1-CHI-01 TaxID=3068482 RepID=UPI0032FCB49A